MKCDTLLYCLLDPRVVESADGARLAPGTVVKDGNNPLFVEDRPWEVRFDNLYANVMRDPRTGAFSCWYNPFIMCEATKTTPEAMRSSVPYRPRAREMGVCYARSSDGLQWEKPDLGIIEFNGSTQNNLVMRDVHGVGVYHDEREADPQRRYKALMTGGGATSPDGLHWTKLPFPDVEAVGDTHNYAFWDGRGQRFVGVTRLWADGQRIVGRTESEDFRTWRKAVEVLRYYPTEPHRQTYALLPFPYGDGYLGLLMLLNTKEDTVDVELAWSTDTIRWERIAPGFPLIPRGPEGSYDHGCIYAAASPIRTESGIFLYYGGGNATHGGWRKGCFALAHLRADGFAGYEPAGTARTAHVVTRPVECTFPHLRITADAAAGAVRVFVVGEDGRKLLVSQPVAGDLTDGTVSWPEGEDLSRCVGARVRLRFELRSAKLYTFRFAAS